MLQEDFISFETAVLLRERGFDEPIFEFYVGDENNIRYARNKDGFRLSELRLAELCGIFYYPHITLQMAHKWIRQQSGCLCINVNGYGVDEERERTSTYRYSYAIINMRTFTEECMEDNFHTYEEALEAGIKRCLTDFKL